MAGARREFLGELAAWHAAAVIAHLPFTARSLDPASINPYRPFSAALARHRAWKAQRRMSLVVNKKRREKGNGNG